MKPYEPRHHGLAEYNSYTEVISGDVPAGATGSPVSAYYAKLVYVVNEGGGSAPATVILSGTDIQIGAVELKSAETSARVDVVETDLLNGLSVAIIDSEGIQVDPYDGTMIAETNVPSGVANGLPVNPWYDEFGRQVIAGYNPTLAALKVVQDNEAMTYRLGPVDNLPEGATSGAGPARFVNSCHNATIHITSTSVISGAVIVVEHSFDDTTSRWAEIAEVVVTESGTEEVAISQQAMMYLRTRVKSRVDGSFHTQIIAGN